jgi:sugar/nucleoside kinase (ribokinase family)
VLWEISADVCSPERLSTIGQAAAQVAALSINQEECAGLFGGWDKSVVIDGLRGLGAPIIFVRCGGDGSFVITPNAVVPIAAQPARIVDVTGAGNAYGGAALAGLLAGADSVEAAHMGAIASRFTLAQHGPFEPRDASVRARARAALLAVSSHPTHQQTLATQP